MSDAAVHELPASTRRGCTLSSVPSPWSPWGGAERFEFMGLGLARDLSGAILSVAFVESSDGLICTVDPTAVQFIDPPA